MTNPTTDNPGRSIRPWSSVRLSGILLAVSTCGFVFAGPDARTNNLIISGGVSRNNSAMFEDLSASGSATDRSQGINNINIRDKVDAGQNLLSGLYIRQQFGGAQSSGNRFGIYSFFSVDQPPCECDTSIKNYTAGTFQSYAKVPAKTALSGGSSYRGYAGSLWGSDNVTNLSGDATNWSSLVGQEIGVSIYSGSSAADRFGLAIYSGGNSQGILDDAGILLASNQNLTAMRYGIEFGGTRKNFPIDKNGTMIGATSRSQGGETKPAALYGVDLRAVRFQSGGAAFASNGFSVDPAGDVTAASVTTGTAQILSGIGSPSGSVSCKSRCLYIRVDGGVGSTLYVNETGEGTSGWTAK